MRLGVLMLAEMFLIVAKEALSPAHGHHRRKQIAAIASGDHVAHLNAKTIHFVEEHRAEGYVITDSRVEEILNAPDRHYCGNLSPRRFVEMSPDKLPVAIMAVRETLREEWGIALPRLSLRELRNYDFRRL